MKLFKKLFDHEYKELKRFEALAREVDALDEEYSKLSDADLKAKTDEFKEKIEGLEEYSYFKVEEFEDDNFILNASGGFSSHKSLYDIGLMVDLNSGFFAIPFLGTFNKIFEDKSQVKNYKKCILEFLFDDKIPPIVFIKHKNVLDIINPILKENGIKEVGSVDELIKIFKSEWENNYGFSSIEALYNSKLFSEYLGFTN